MEPHSSSPSIIDWPRLLQPVSASDPSGPNLEYVPEFADLERAARGTPNRQMGAALLPGEPPDPAAVTERAVALLGRSKDVRLVVHLLQAQLASDGLGAFLAGLGALRDMLERFWETVHPGLDPDDDARATARANALVELASPEWLLALRRAPLIEAQQGGGVSLEQMSQAARDAAAASPGEIARLAAAFREQSPVALAALERSFELGLEQVRAISALFEAQAALPPDLAPLGHYLAEALALLGSHRPPAELGAVERLTPPASSPSRKRARANVIDSRQDVLQALDEICCYYAEREPSSPLPLLLRRCQRLAGLDFVETLRELAPEALPKFELISGSSSQPTHSN